MKHFWKSSRSGLIQVAWISNLVSTLLQQTGTNAGSILSIQKTCEANPVGENSSLICAVCVKSVPLYHFHLACVVLHLAVKEFLESHF